MYALALVSNSHQVVHQCIMLVPRSAPLLLPVSVSTVLDLQHVHVPPAYWFMWATRDKQNVWPVVVPLAGGLPAAATGVVHPRRDSGRYSRLFPVAVLGSRCIVVPAHVVHDN